MGKKYKNIIIDLDNTIFNTKETEYIALEKTSQKIAVDLGNISAELVSQELLKSMNSIRMKGYEELASEHRGLYFINALRKLHPINVLENSKKYYNIFNSHFLDELKTYDGVFQFLEKCQASDITVIAGTNNLLFPQIDRLTKLNLNKYFKDIYSAQEIGIKKPSEEYFKYILDKMKISPQETLMIGDNPKTDGGSATLGIDCYVFTQQIIAKDNIKTFPSYLKLTEELF